MTMLQLLTKMVGSHRQLKVFLRVLAFQILGVEQDPGVVHENI